jgi:hypothetical protein
MSFTRVDARSSFGSATAVDRRGYFLTAAHCVSAGPVYLFCSPKSDGIVIMVRGRVVWRGETMSSDLAIVSIDQAIGRAFEWSAEPAKGEPGLGFGAGYPGLGNRENLDSSIRYINAVIPEAFAETLQTVKPAEATPGVRPIEAAGLVHPGDSGGPLVALDGRLIAINVAWSHMFEVDGHIYRVPWDRPRAVALRPDLGWLRETIDDDYRRRR